MYFQEATIVLPFMQLRSEATGPLNKRPVENSQAVPNDKNEEKMLARKQIKAPHSVAGDPRNDGQNLDKQQAGQHCSEYGYWATDDRIRFLNAGMKKDDGRSKIEQLKSYEKNRGIHFSRIQSVSDHVMILTAREHNAQYGQY